MTWTISRNAALLERARQVIPGGMYGHQSTALLPEVFPQFFARADGTRLWDVDDHVYIDYMCAYGPNLLGYRHSNVEAAARAQAALGDTMTGPAPIMVDLAEQLVAMVGHADWAMFCKNGTDATTLALMTARAYRDRPKILLAHSTYHGTATWCTPRLAGTVPEDRVHIVTYRYNDIESLESVFRQHRGDIAGVFATPFRHEAFEGQALADRAYARAVRGLCDEEDALLVVDDVRAGFRIARDCSWSTLGVQPDLSCWGKVLANGYPLSALLGSEKTRAAAQRLYVTGSFWFSAVPMAAALATLREIRETNYLERLVHAGQMFRAGLAEQATAFGFDLRQTGPVQLPHIAFAGDFDLRLGFAWTAAALRHGVLLSPYHNMFMNAAITETDVAASLRATGEAFQELKATRASLGPNANPFVRARLRLPDVVR